MNDSSATRTPSGPGPLKPLAGELLRMVQLRRELAALEIGHDRALLRRFLLVGGPAAVLTLVGAPLLLLAAARAVAHTLGWDETLSILAAGALFTLPGAVMLILAIRKLRAQFCALRGTLAELNEDLVWLREWTERDDAQ
jgi:uncharacterized membrane protein YqjE